MQDFDDNPAGPQPVFPRFGPPTKSNPLWRAVIVAGGLFCLSCLLWITAGFADQQAPGNRWLNENGLLLVGLSGAASIFSAIGAMVTDSVQTRRMLCPPGEQGESQSRGDTSSETAFEQSSIASFDPAAEPRS
jgi:hypothetical protein